MITNSKAIRNSSTAMVLKRFTIVAAIVLCLFASEEEQEEEKEKEKEKLKCIQCGMSLIEVTRQIFTKEVDKKTILNAMKMRPEKFYCSLDEPLPEPMECERVNDKFCIKTKVGNYTVRYCSPFVIDVCQDGNCSYSCDSNGCNTAEHLTSSNGRLTLAAILGLLYANLRT